MYFKVHFSDAFQKKGARHTRFQKTVLPSRSKAAPGREIFLMLEHDGLTGYLQSCTHALVSESCNNPFPPPSWQMPSCLS